jgi:hypothetical protein
LAVKSALDMLWGDLPKPDGRTETPMWGSDTVKVVERRGKYVYTWYERREGDKLLIGPGGIARYHVSEVTEDGV